MYILYTYWYHFNRETLLNTVVCITIDLFSIASSEDCISMWNTFHLGKSETSADSTPDIHRQYTRHPPTVHHTSTVCSPLLSVYTITFHSAVTSSVLSNLLSFTFVTILVGFCFHYNSNSIDKTTLDI